MPSAAAASKPGRRGLPADGALRLESGRLHVAQLWPTSLPRAPAPAAPSSSDTLRRRRQLRELGLYSSGDEDLRLSGEGEREPEGDTQRSHSETEIVRPVKPKRKSPAASKCKQSIGPTKWKKLLNPVRKDSDDSPPRRRPERKRRKDETPPLHKISKRKSLQKLFRKALYFFEGLRTCNEIASTLPRLPSSRKVTKDRKYRDDSSRQRITSTESESESITRKSPRRTIRHHDRGDTRLREPREAPLPAVVEVEGSAGACPVHSCTCPHRHAVHSCPEPLTEVPTPSITDTGRLSIISDDWAFPVDVHEKRDLLIPKPSLSIPLMNVQRATYPYVHPWAGGQLLKHEVIAEAAVLSEATRPDLLPPNTPQPISDVTNDDPPKQPFTRTFKTTSVSPIVRTPSSHSAEPTANSTPHPNYSQEILLDRPTLRRRGRFYFRFRLNNRLQKRLSHMFRPKEATPIVQEIEDPVVVTPVPVVSESSSMVSASIQKSVEVIQQQLSAVNVNSGIHPLFQMGPTEGAAVVENFVTSLTSVLQTLNSELHRSSKELGRADEKLRAAEAENVLLRNKILMGPEVPVTPKVSTESGSTLTPDKSNVTQTETSKSEIVQPVAKVTRPASPRVPEKRVSSAKEPSRRTLSSKPSEKETRKKKPPVKEGRSRKYAKGHQPAATESSDNSVVYGMCRPTFSQATPPKRPGRHLYENGQLSTMSDDNLVQRMRDNPYRQPSSRSKKSREFPEEKVPVRVPESLPVVESCPALPVFFHTSPPSRTVTPVSRNVSIAEPVDSRLVSSCNSMTSTDKPPTVTAECQTGPELLATTIGCQTSSNEGLSMGAVPGNSVTAHSSDSSVQVSEAYIRPATPDHAPEPDLPVVKVGVNISDSTIVDSETGKMFQLANDKNLSDSVHSDEEPVQGKLKVSSDARRLSDAQLQAKLHSIQSATDGATVHPLKEFLEYLFFLLGLRGPYPEDDYFVPVCHVEDAHILWNSWKTKLFTLPQHAASDAEDERAPLGKFAYYTIDRLFHFINTYCVVRGWAFTLINKESYQASGDLKAIFELTHKGIIEIPADRPKIFTDDDIQNRRIIRLFLMNSFRLDRNGQQECIRRQKCLYYMHLFKNDAINNPTRDDIRLYRDLLQHCKVPEVASFSKKDRVLVEIVVRNWLAYKPLLHVETALDMEYQKLRAETKRWLTQTTLVNFRNRYGQIGALRMMADKYLRGMLGTMQHEYRTFVSNILRIEQDPQTHRWRLPDKFLENVENAGLENAVHNYMVPYRFSDKYALPNQEPVLTKKEAGREETFNIVEDLYAQQQRPPRGRGGAPKVDLRSVAKAQNYKKQMNNPDVRRHLMETGKLAPAGGRQRPARPISPLDEQSEDEDLRSERTQRTRRTQRPLSRHNEDDGEEAPSGGSDSSISVKLNKKEIETPRQPYIPPAPVQAPMHAPMHAPMPMTNNYQRSQLAASSPFLQNMTPMMPQQAPVPMYQPPPFIPSPHQPQYRPPMPAPSVSNQPFTAPSSVQAPVAPSVAGTQRTKGSTMGQKLQFSPNITRFVASKLHTPVKTKSPPAPTLGFSNTDMFSEKPSDVPAAPSQYLGPSPAAGDGRFVPPAQRPDRGFPWNTVPLRR